MAATATHTQNARHRCGALNEIVAVVGAAVRAAVSDISSTLLPRKGQAVRAREVSLDG